MWQSLLLAHTEWARARARRRDWFLLLQNAPSGLRLGWNARVAGGNITLGSDVEIEDYAVLATRDWNGDRIKLGNKCKIRSGTQLHSWGGFIEIGDDCSLNPYCVFYGSGGITLGNNVRIGAHTTMFANSHVTTRTDIPITQQGQTKLGITVEDDVWIGAGVRVLDGVRVGKGSILAAGAVVNRDVAPFSIVGGVPARLIRMRQGPDANPEPETQRS